MSLANLEKYQEVVKNQDQNITFYLRHRIRLLQLLGDLKNGKLANLDSINDTLVNVEKRKLALGQHLIDLDSDYYQILKDIDRDDNKLEAGEQKGDEEVQKVDRAISLLNEKLKRITRYRSDMITMNRLLTTSFEADSIKISESQIKEVFKLDNEDDFQLILRKGDLIDNKNKLYKFSKIEFSKNLKQLSDSLKKEKQDCEDLKLKIEKDRLQWNEKRLKFTQICTGFLDE